MVKWVYDFWYFNFKQKNSEISEFFITGMGFEPMII